MPQLNGGDGAEYIRRGLFSMGRNSVINDHLSNKLWNLYKVSRQFPLFLRCMYLKMHCRREV